MAGYAPITEGLTWLVSKTCDGGACIMVARDNERIVFGDTTEPDGSKVAYTRAEFKEFAMGVKRGDFDELF
jgi:hypothetical protein